MYIVKGWLRSRWLCSAVTSMPPAASLVMTGLTSVSVSTRSPITMPCAPIFSKASQPPSERKAGLQLDAVECDFQIGARQADAVDAAGRRRPGLSQRLADLRLP